MESKDPLVELLSNLEQIVFKEVPQPVRHSTKNSVFTEYELLRRGTGLKLDDFARAMGVSVTQVQEWEAKRDKPSQTDLKLMRFIQANPVRNQQTAE